MMNFCPSCGKPLNPATRFCPFCGAAVAAEPVAASETSAAAVREPSEIAGRRASALKWPIVAGCIVAAVIFGWIYYSPYLALRNLKQAALAGNTDALKDAVDFPALRASLKEELGGQLAMHAVKEMNKDDEPFAALGTALAGGLVNAFIDQFVTPQVVASVVQRKKIGDTPGELPELIDRFAAEPKTGAVASEPKVLTGYESLNRFSIRIFPPKSKVAVTLVLLRSGLTNWRLSGIRVPDLDELTKETDEASTGTSGGAQTTPIPASDASAGLQGLRQCAHEQFDDSCLNIPALQERLDSLLATLPKDRRQTDFAYSLTVSREGFLDGDVVTLSGMQPHAAPYAGVAISADLRTGAVLVAIHAAEKLAVYGAADKTLGSLPPRMQTWIQSREENMRPTSVTVVFL